MLSCFYIICFKTQYVMLYQYIYLKEILLNSNMNYQCEHCQLHLLDSIGTQYYCIACDRTNNQIQQEIKFVPPQYSSNYKNKRQLKLEKVINEYIRQFSDKYKTIHNLEQLALLRSKVFKILSTKKHAKGVRQTASVVVFCELRDYIKSMNIRVSIRQFNTKYKIYYKLFIQQSKNIMSLQQIKKQTKKNQYFQQEIIKIQQKGEEIIQKQNDIHYLNQRMLIQQQNDGYLLNFDFDKSSSNYRIIDKQQQDYMISYQQYHINIMTIYDEIFTNYYLKNKKQHVSKQLIKKLNQIDYTVLEEIRKKQPNKCFRAYYLIYAVLKQLGNKLGFYKFQQIIKSKTGVSLKFKTSHDIQQLLQNRSRDQFRPQETSNIDGGIKIEQKYSQINQMTVHCSFMNVSSFYNEDEFFN